MRDKKESLFTIIKGKTFEQVKDILTKPPYNCLVNDDGDLYIIKYNQIRSDFSYTAVRQCRGIILEKGTNKVICRAFDKFFNFGETHAAKIDWNSARVEEKIDGSIIKLFYYNGWRIATNGVINAHKASLNTGIDTYGKTFGYLFISVALRMNLVIRELDKNFTYMFELVSPYNRVVVPYKIDFIYHIGTRETLTGKELDINIGVSKPRKYRFNSIEDIIRAAEELPFDNEGYVVVDKNWNRIKIKSPAYVAIHHLKDNGAINRRRILDIIRKNEYEEFISYFPEYEGDASKISIELSKFCVNLGIDAMKSRDKKLETRKDFAMWAKTKTCPDFLFKFLDRKVKSVDEYIDGISSEKLEKLIAR